jgi:hypothetical protein
MLSQNLVENQIVEEAYKEVVEFCHKNDIMPSGFKDDKIVIFRSKDSSFQLFILPNGSLYISEQVVDTLMKLSDPLTCLKYLLLTEITHI